MTNPLRSPVGRAVAADSVLEGGVEDADDFLLLGRAPLEAGSEGGAEDDPGEGDQEESGGEAAESGAHRFE